MVESELRNRVRERLEQSGKQVEMTGTITTKYVRGWFGIGHCKNSEALIVLSPSGDTFRARQIDRDIRIEAAAGELVAKATEESTGFLSLTNQLTFVGPLPEISMTEPIFRETVIAIGEAEWPVQVIRKGFSFLYRVPAFECDVPVFDIHDKPATFRCFEPALWLHCVCASYCFWRWRMRNTGG